MSKSSGDVEVSEEFTKVIYDLVNDILFTFPEYKEKLDENLYKIKENKDENSVKFVYSYVQRVFPERFFDILYKNEEIFKKDSEVNTEFLPGIDFKNIWNEDISDNTKETLWKYLQIILFAAVGKINSEDSFGDTAKLFEAINEEELKKKLEETMNNLQNMMHEENGNMNETFDISGVGMDNFLNPDDIQDHITGLLDGKLGKLAKEIAEETAEELNIDTEDASSVNDVFKSLFKNPGKLMSLVKNVGGKLDSKLKSGELNESEIMQEASDLLNKMKNMPGMGDISSILKKMGMPGAGGAGGKVNLGAMQNELNKNLKIAKMKERLRKKAEMKKTQDIVNVMNQNQNTQKPLTEAEVDELVFSIGEEKPEKSMRSSNNKKKKKKGKK